MAVDIVIAGIGGQGSILASRALARAAIKEGLPVMTSEVLGMAQREGSVVGHVRLGHPFCGPIIPERQANVLLGLELYETARQLKLLHPEGMIIASDEAIFPPTIAGNPSIFPSAWQVISYLQQSGRRVCLVPAAAAARSLGNVRVTNVILLGCLAASNILPFSADLLLEELLLLLPPVYRQLNEKAFATGIELYLTSQVEVSQVGN